VKHNPLAVVVAVVASQALGFLRYGVFFVDVWGRDAGQGAALGFMVWLFFVGGTVATHHAFGQVGPGATLVEVSNALVSLILVGAIVGAWLPGEPEVLAAP